MRLVLYFRRMVAVVLFLLYSCFSGRREVFFSFIYIYAFVSAGTFIPFVVSSLVSSFL